MKVYFGFDDTDTNDSLYGTGKLVRWFQGAMPEGCECLGVVRQQLFVCDEIPYTSHNSAACLIADMAAPDLLNEAIEKAANHLRRWKAVILGYAWLLNLTPLSKVLSILVIVAPVKFRHRDRLLRLQKKLIFPVMVAPTMELSVPQPLLG